MANLLDKASILLTPTAYNNGSMLSVKPTDGDGDFTFSRNSAATRVNAQGLVENVQILSGDLVQNGSFSEIGAEQVTNGSFSNGSTDWTFVGEAELTEQGARIYSSSGGQSYINQDALTNTKSYKISYDIVDSTQGALKLINVNGVSDYPIPSTVGSHIVYFTANNNTLFIYRNSGATDVTITNISVKEVGQNWTFGDGFTPDQANSKATCDGTQSAATNLTQTISTNIQNKLVRVSFTLDYTAGVLLGSLSGTGAVDFNNITSSGTYTAEMTSNEVSPPLILQGDTNFIGSITNIVIKEVTNDTDLPRINYEGFSYQDVLGSELLTNGDFATNIDGWGGNTTRTWNDGTLVSVGVGAGNNTNIQVGSILTAGKTYRFTWEILSTDANASFVFTSSEGQITNSYVGAGTFTEDVTIVSNSTYVDFRFTGANTTTVFKSLSVKEVLGQEVVPDSGCGSWLLEDESTNLIPYSEDFSSLNAVANAVVTSNQIISPSGLLDADEITFDGTLYGRVEASISATVGQPYTISLYLKNKDLSDVTQVWIGFSQTGQGQFVTITDEWQRYDITTNADGTTEYPRIQFSGSGSLYAWGFQTEQQSYATSYIPTSGASSTRLRDIATDSGNASLINSTEGVFYVEITALANYNSQRWISLNDGTHNNTIKIGFLNSATNYKIAADVRVGGVNQAFLAYDFGAVAPTFKKCAIKYKQNDFALWIDGVEAATDTNGNTPIGLNNLKFTRGDAAQNFFGKVKALAVYKEELTDAELTALTTI